MIHSLLASMAPTIGKYGPANTDAMIKVGTRFEEMQTSGGGEPTSVSSAHVAYMMSVFPKVTETFVIDEIAEITRQGIDVSIFPLRRGTFEVVHDTVVTHMPRVEYTPYASWDIARAHSRKLRSNPKCYFAVLAELLRANLGSPRFLAGAMAFFPKAVLLAELMSQRGIQHVHAHFASHPAAIAYAIHRLTGIRFSFTAHASDIHRDQHMLREKVAAAEFVIACSQYNREFMIDACGPEIADKIHVIHCGIDTDQFHPSAVATPFAQRKGRPRIVCCGRLRELKGQRYLLAALARLRQNGYHYDCDLIGDGPDRDSLFRQAQNAGLDSVRFLGALTHSRVRDALQRADMFVLPSVQDACGRREGIPVALMEAMACGIPVIGSRISGIPELVVHEKTGLLVGPRDAAGLADAILRLHSDNALRGRLALEGRQKVVREFSRRESAQRLRHLIVNGNNRPCSRNESCIKLA